jgi:hypothetical protein
MLRAHEKTVSVRRPAVLKRPCPHLPSKDCTCNSLGSVPPFCTSSAKRRLALSASKTMVHHATLPIRFAASNRYDQPGESNGGNATQCNTMLRVSRKNCISPRTARLSKTLRASPIKEVRLQQLRLRSSILCLASQAAPGAVRLEDHGSPCNTMQHHATQCHAYTKKPF